jgi:hypothetical protein
MSKLRPPNDVWTLSVAPQSQVRVNQLALSDKRL